MRSDSFLYKYYYQWWKNIDKSIFLLISLLFFIGLFISLVSTSLIASDKFDTNSYSFFFRHLMYIFIGIFIIYIFSSIHSDTLFTYSIILFFVTFTTLFLVPIIGVEVKGSKRWINLIFFNFQPIELLKPSIILFLAGIFSSDKSFIIKFFLSGLIISSAVIVLLLQPDYTQALIILLVWFTIVFLSGVSLAIIISALSVTIGIMVSVLFFFKNNFSYIFLRFENWLSSNNISYQSEKSIDAIKHGGFFGQGIGEGILKEKIPEAHTDYVLASISEEYGIIIIIFVLIIVFSLFMRVFAICQNEISSFKKYTLIALSTLILSQIFINVGVTINLLPSTGMTFSFLSYGGSSILTSAFIMGIILALTKNKL